MNTLHIGASESVLPAQDTYLATPAVHLGDAQVCRACLQLV